MPLIYTRFFVVAATSHVVLARHFVTRTYAGNCRQQAFNRAARGIRSQLAAVGIDFLQRTCLLLYIGYLNALKLIAFGLHLDVYRHITGR